jgi:hypothetical protein
MFFRAYQKSPTRIQVDLIEIHPPLTVARLQITARLDLAFIYNLAVPGSAVYNAKNR